MNLHGMVRGVISSVNPDIIIQFKKSTGYTKSADFKQIPSYDTAIPVQAQIQALSKSDLKHLASLNITTVQHKVYMFGNQQMAVRADGTGGDILSFASPGSTTVRDWKIMTVFETWHTGWCAFGVAMQVPGATS